MRVSSSSIREQSCRSQQNGNRDRRISHFKLQIVTTNLLRQERFVDYKRLSESSCSTPSCRSRFETSLMNCLIFKMLWSFTDKAMLFTDNFLRAPTARHPHLFEAQKARPLLRANVRGAPGFKTLRLTLILENQWSDLIPAPQSVMSTSVAGP